VDFRGHDPALDSWPVNRTDLDAVLASGNALTPEFVRNLDPTLKGFHTAEYLLFAFSIDQLGDREFEYLIAVVTDIELTATELLNDWIAGPEPFGDVMKTAGSNSVFPSQVSALEQIIEGMSVILDEVANGKIAEPFDNQDVEAVESQFSFNSRADFADDIRGVLYSYTGDQPLLGINGTGIDELVAETDPDLAGRVENEINDAIDAILAIPQPFRDAILDPNAADDIVAAQEACVRVFNTLNGEVLPVIRQ
jgi:predicted lipoprotein